MIREEKDGVWTTLRESISVHHQEVFDLLTTADGLTRWFPVAAEIDLRTGGQIVFGWDEELTRKSTVAILKYDSGGEIVWDWFAVHRDMHAPVYWKVTPDVEKGAKVTMRQGPFRDDRDSLIALAEEAESWRWYLCNMRAVLEGGLDMRHIRPL